MGSVLIKNQRETFIVREKIMSEINGGSMVARRLLWLLGKADLSNVNQILDIGSWHLGQSIEFSNVFPHARIDAFEPVPSSHQLCMNRLTELDEQQRNRIRVHNIALSNSTGEIPFYPVDTTISKGIDAGFSSMFRFGKNIDLTFPNQKWVQNEIMVETDTLDNWCVKNNINDIDIIWMDVQGAELLVLQGAINILKHTKIILTEVGLKPYYEGHTLKSDIDEILTEMGFEELKNSREMNIQDYEENTIYINQSI